MFNIPDSCYDYRHEQPQAIVVDICEDCGEEIHEGDEYYSINKCVLCVECMRIYKKVGEILD